MGGEVIIIAGLTMIGFIVGAFTAGAVGRRLLGAGLWPIVGLALAASAIVSVIFLAAYFSARPVQSWQFLLLLAVVQALLLYPGVRVQARPLPRLGAAMSLALLQPAAVVAAWVVGFGALSSQ